MHRIWRPDAREVWRVRLITPLFMPLVASARLAFDPLLLDAHLEQFRNLGPPVIPCRHRALRLPELVW
jgi:hypothetical protein